MTYEEALAINQNINAIQARNDLERYLLRDEPPIYKGVALAMQALEKQIPQKVIEQTEDDREFIDYVCPNCKTTLQQKNKQAKRITIYKYKHCIECGQALVWGGTE